MGCAAAVPAEKGHPWTDPQQEAYPRNRMLPSHFSCSVGLSVAKVQPMKRVCPPFPSWAVLLLLPLTDQLMVVRAYNCNDQVLRRRLASAVLGEGK